MLFVNDRNQAVLGPNWARPNGLIFVKSLDSPCLAYLAQVGDFVNDYKRDIAPSCNDDGTRMHKVSYVANWMLLSGIRKYFRGLLFDESDLYVR